MKKIFTLFAVLMMAFSLKAATETVYFVNAANWSKVNVYAWEPVQNANWPGVAATKEADQIAGCDVYSYTADAGKYANVIFNNGSGAQTADLKWTAGKYYVKDGWYTKEEAAVKLGQPIEYESVYFVDNQGWGKANIYTWTPEVGTWPGVAMTKEANQLAGYNVYSYTVEKGTSFGGMLFNNGSGTQTSDLVWTAGKYYVKDGWYTKEEAEAKLAGPVTTTWTMVGDKALFGTEWDLNASANDLVKQNDGSWVLTLNNKTLAAKSYEYKAAKDRAWTTTVPGGDNAKLTISKAGNYDVIFTLNSANTSVTAKATYIPATYTVTVTAENGTVTGAGEYEENTEVTLVATANEGYEFVNWTAGETVVSIENPYKFTVTADVALVANFKLITLHKVLAGEDLQAAVNKANSGDTVLVQAGTYEGNFTMKDGVYVSGGWNADFTAQAEHASILDAKENGRVLNQAADFETVTIWDNFTIQNGKLTAADGVKNLGAGVALMKKGRVINCLIQNNTFTYSGTCIGGGIGQDVGDRNDTCAINCVVRNNQASHGGGVRIRGVILNSVIEYNKTTTNAAGGMHLQGGAAYNCIIRYNESLKDLGGVRLYGACDLVNCLIVGNKCAGKVGGLQAESAPSNIINCTIVGNEQAATGSEAVFCGFRDNVNDAAKHDGKFFVNNVVYGNKAGGEVQAEQVHTYIKHYVTNGTFANNAFQDVAAIGGTYIQLGAENDPQFTENYGIAWTSPLYNAGNNDVVDKILGGKDVYGNARKQGANMEIGAVEHTEYKATIEIGEGGALEVDYTGEKTPLVAGEISLPAGFTTKLYVTPAANYALETITLNGEALEAVEGVYTIPAVTGDITLVAKFQEAAVAATITWELNGGVFPEVKVPTNEELALVFKQEYAEYFAIEGLTDTDMKREVGNFIYVTNSKGGDAVKFITENANWKWLHDYILTVAGNIPEGTNVGYYWRANLDGFFHCKNAVAVGGVASADYTEAGKPEAWGPAYQAAHEVVLPTEPVEEDYVLPTPTREGYTFVGWYDNAEGEGEAMIVLPAGWAGTLYAIWKVEGPATALENIAVEGKAIKTIINGQVLIIRDGKTFNMMGQEVK